MTRCGHAEKKDLDAARYEERFSVSENPPLDTGRKHKKKPQLGIQTPINQTLAPFPRESSKEIQTILICEHLKEII